VDYLKIIVGMSGATGAIFGIRILQFLKEFGAETHLILSPWAVTTIQLETPYTAEEIGH
jgi:4-hydroxy-3-polyprenylbenzoate decarboxylase